MKGFLIILFFVLTSETIAQENEHIKGNEVGESSENNSILRVSSLRNALEVDVLAYPNPSNGVITVSAPEMSVLTLYMDNGVYVGTWNVDQTGKVEMVDLPSGMLILTIVKDTERVVRKVVVL
jgi:hypothetical protein